MQLKTTDIKGKPYVQVNERLKYFRTAFVGYSLETELVDVNNETALVKAVIRDPMSRIVATGTAYERANAPGSMVNKTSHVENAETSAWGRALGNLGIGIDTSVASAEEVSNALLDQADATADQMKRIEDLVTQLGRDRQKMWAYFGVVNGKPTGLQAALIISKLETFKKNLSAELDS